MYILIQEIMAKKSGPGNGTRPARPVRPAANNAGPKKTVVVDREKQVRANSKAIAVKDVKSKVIDNPNSRNTPEGKTLTAGYKRATSMGADTMFVNKSSKTIYNNKDNF